jgi:hypothetical protein
MRRISANYVFPVSGPPLKNGIIEFDNQGKIISVTDPGNDFKEISGIEFYNGILIPKLILPYCRLEPYIFQAEITNYPDLRKFITRELHEITSSDGMDHRFNSLDRYLMKSGIYGVGCITNRFHFFRNKSEGKVNYHSFIEILPEKKTDPFESFNRAINVMTVAWNDYGLRSSLIPYSFCGEEDIVSYISDYSFVHDNPLILGCPGKKISSFSVLKKFILILSRLTGKTDSQAFVSFKNPIIVLAHDLDDSIKDINDNTFFMISADDSDMDHYHLNKKEYWRRFSGNLLFSNYLFNIKSNVPLISELINLQLKIPCLSFEDLIQCYTLNPARALRMDHQAGSIIPGKIPGINLITHFNFDSFKLTEKSEIKLIV